MKKRKRPTETERKFVEEKADEIFKAIENAQGYFFVSDGEGAGMTEAEFFERIRGRLAWGERAVNIMHNFLAKYRQTDAAMRAAKEKKP